VDLTIAPVAAIEAVILLPGEHPLQEKRVRAERQRKRRRALRHHWQDGWREFGDISPATGAKLSLAPENEAASLADWDFQVSVAPEGESHAPFIDNIEN